MKIIYLGVICQILHYITNMKTIEKFLTPWLQQRQEILTNLYNLAGLLPKNIEKNNISLTCFFQILIDYMCAGHLQIFNLLIKRNSINLSQIKNILHQINCNTNNIIKFNYKFNKFHNISAIDIANLLEEFANRIELEDILLHTKHFIQNKNLIN